MTVLLIIFLIIIFILLSKIKIEILYKRIEDDDILKLTFVYLKYIRFSYNISLIDISTNERGFGFKLVSSLMGNKKRDKHKEFLDINTIKRFVRLFRKYFNHYRRIFRYIVRKLTINELETEMQIGFSNPAVTGVITGVLYSVIYNVFALLSNLVRICSHRIKIEPVFNKSIFNIYFFCIFTIRIGNIIYVCLQFILMFLMYKFRDSKEIKINTNMR